ncbi:type VI secretion system-associated protein TagO [Citrobacter werkmanii]|uniref:type VI secretion system-associated protein TagO n=1 Tax=Citrobacter werkmanii TaxID=67827 RepID=UPI0015E6A348|nr:type VI secretion system-associated protein TagO [Citrobacter werkmanii]HCR4011190.1 hypothetical protein [Citrobacter werkmanii]
MKRVILLLSALTFYGGAANADLVRQGSWVTDSKVNKMTDETDFIAINTSPDTYIKSGSQRDTSLVLRCNSNKTEVFLSFHDFMGSTDPAITIRLDGGKPVKRTWGGGEGEDSAFSPNPVQLVKELSKHKKAIFGFEPYGSTMQVVEFDLTGMDKILDKLSESCNWS